MIRTLIAALLVATPALATPALADPTVFAAASTGRALDAAIAASGQSVITSYGASGTLARQVEQGAPVDLYLSANPKWMAFLVDAGIVRQEDVVVLMSNNLVLIAPEGAGPFDPDHIADFLGDGLFAMGDPDVAPVGRYGQAALTSLGLWDQVATALYTSCEALRAVALLMAPFLPETAPVILERLGLPDALSGTRLPDDAARFGALQPGTPTTKGAPLFPRIEVPDGDAD